jgi:serine/threonine protein kinase
MIVLETGDTLCGRYNLLKRLGEGQNGVTFLASDESSQLPNVDGAVVLKVLFRSDPQILGRFESEAEALRRVNSRRIPNIFDWGRDKETGLLYLAQEYAKGLDSIHWSPNHLDSNGLFATSLTFSML